MAAISSVKPFIVRAPARLHFGFLDLHGGIGRRFGGSGMALVMPMLRIKVQPASTFVVRGEANERIQAVAKHLFNYYQCAPFGDFEVQRTIPEHHGLGSGTQTALAMGHAIARLCDIRSNSIAIAQQTGRGRRSGIGIGAFDCGGFLVDGGKKGHEPAPIIARIGVPRSWRAILITCVQDVGVHGVAEKKRFDNLPDFSEDDAKFLCRILLLGILPALVQGDFGTFARMLTRMQDKVGDYFAAVQGNRYANPKVCEVLEYLRRHNVQCTGQSSWGPTGFVLTPSINVARRVVDLVRAQFDRDSGIRVSITQADNQGGFISNDNI